MLMACSMPNDRIEAQDISHALAQREVALGPPTREAIRQLATGLLRQLHTGTADPVMDPLRRLLGVNEKAQVAQRTVDWCLEGIRDNPPFPQRPQLRGAMSELFQQTSGRNATTEELDTLVNALVGIERDVVLAPGPMPRMVIGGKLVDAFVLGA